MTGKGVCALSLIFIIIVTFTTWLGEGRLSLHAWAVYGAGFLGFLLVVYVCLALALWGLA